MAGGGAEDASNSHEEAKVGGDGGAGLAAGIEACGKLGEVLKKDVISGVSTKSAEGAGNFKTKTTLGMLLKDGTTVDEMVIGGPLSNCKKIARLDEIVKVDGVPVTAANIGSKMIGSDVPGSAVILTVRKHQGGGLLEVRVVRMRTQEIADRRRLFELFTWLLDNNKAAKEPEPEKKRAEQAHDTVKHCITLWTGMMQSGAEHNEEVACNVQALQRQASKLNELVRLALEAAQKDEDGAPVRAAAAEQRATLAEAAATAAAAETEKARRDAEAARKALEEAEERSRAAAAEYQAMREAAERKAEEEAARRERQEQEASAEFERRLQNAGEEAQRALDAATREAEKLLREAQDAAEALLRNTEAEAAARFKAAKEAAAKSLQEEQDAREGENKRAAQAAAALREEADALRKALAQDGEEAAKERKDAEERQARLRTEAEETEKRLKGLIADLEEEVRNLTEQGRVKSEKIKDFEGQVARLKTQLEEAAAAAVACAEATAKEEARLKQEGEAAAEAGCEREGVLSARIEELEKSEADGLERERVLQSEGDGLVGLVEDGRAREEALHLEIAALKEAGRAREEVLQQELSALREELAALHGVREGLERDLEGLKQALQEAAQREAALEARKAELEALEALLTSQRNRARAQVDNLGVTLSREIGERGAEVALGGWLRLNCERKGEERLQMVRVQHAAVAERKRIKTFLLTSIHEWVLILKKKRTLAQTSATMKKRKLLHWLKNMLAFWRIQCRRQRRGLAAAHRAMGRLMYKHSSIAFAAWKRALGGKVQDARLRASLHLSDQITKLLFALEPAANTDLAAPNQERVLRTMAQMLLAKEKEMRGVSVQLREMTQAAGELWDTAEDRDRDLQNLGIKSIADMREVEDDAKRAREREGNLREMLRDRDATIEHLSQDLSNLEALGARHSAPLFRL